MPRRNRGPQRIDTLKRRIAAVDLICSGTLLKRWRVCGKPNCRCATDPHSRHGPYYEWNRYFQGKLRHTVVSPDGVQEVRRVLDNYQRVLQLLEQWDEESIRLVLGGAHAKLVIPTR